MKRSALVLMGTMILLPAVSNALEPDPSFKILLKSGNKSESCSATALFTSPKAGKCFAVTARDCVPVAGAKEGTATLKAAELGETPVDFYEAPGKAALLGWTCPHPIQESLPSLLFANWYTDKPLRLETSVRFGRKGLGDDRSAHLETGSVAKVMPSQTLIHTHGQDLAKEDMGRPLLCRSDMESGPVKISEYALCGVLVSPSQSRFATGETFAFFRRKLKELGVPELKKTVENGKVFPLAEP